MISCQQSIFFLTEDNALNNFLHNKIHLKMTNIQQTKIRENAALQCKNNDKNLLPQMYLDCCLI